jgi:hypothetical protein
MGCMSFHEMIPLAKAFGFGFTRGVGGLLGRSITSITHANTYNGIRPGPGAGVFKCECSSKYWYNQATYLKFACHEFLVHGSQQSLSGWQDNLYRKGMERARHGRVSTEDSRHSRLLPCCRERIKFSIPRNLFEPEGLCIQMHGPLYTSRSPFQVASGRFSLAALLKNLETYSGLTMYGLWDTNSLSVSISPPESFTFAIIPSWAWTGIARSSSQTR